MGEIGAKFPDSLEGFVPKKLIGEGGFGHVWLAQQKNLDRPVAIKVGRTPIRGTDSALRFERECAALGRLTGKSHIVDVYTSGFIDGGVPYLVMEYVDGGTLRSEGSELSEPQITTAMLQLCSAIQSAHEAEILHRDLKPENVLLRQNGEIVVGDFGIARLADRDHTADGIPATLMYAAPEVLEGAEPTYRSDIYGIGVTMASVVLGRSPFDLGDNASPTSIIARILRGSTSFIDQSETSSRLASAINQAMMRDPMARPATVSQLAELLMGSSTRSVTAPMSARVDGYPSARAAGSVSSAPNVSSNPNGGYIGPAANDETTKRSKLWLAVGAIAVCIASAVGYQALNGGSPEAVATSDPVPFTGPGESSLPEPTTTPPTPDPEVTVIGESLSGARGAGAPVSLNVSDYSFPLELAAGNGCQPGSDKLPDGVWFVTFPDLENTATGGDVEVNLICAFDATSIRAQGYETEFVGWLFEDRSNVVRIVETTPGLDYSSLQDERAYQIEISSSVVVSIEAAG